MNAAATSRARDRRDAAGPVDPAPLVGSWAIFADETTGLTRVEVSSSGGGVRARAFGSAAAGEADWGEAEARVFADDAAGTEVWGFLAAYEHEDARVQLNGYLNRGLLAVEAATTFTDDSGRSPYFTRTFMYRR
jgi:hypothetical protein